MKSSINDMVQRRRSVRELRAGYEALLGTMAPTIPLPGSANGGARNQAYNALRRKIYELRVQECDITLCMHKASTIPLPDNAKGNAKRNGSDSASGSASDSAALVQVENKLYAARYVLTAHRRTYRDE